MKKLSLASLIILIITILFFTVVPDISYAIEGSGHKRTSSGGSPESEYTTPGIDPFSYDPDGSGEIDAEAVAKHVGPIYNIMYGISIIVAVISVSIIGLKFIVGSASEKAEYKQHSTPVIVGILVISCIFSIIGTLAKLAQLF